MPSVVLQRLTAGAAEQQNQKKKKQAALANSGEWMIVPNVEHLRACRTPTGPNKAKNEIHHSNLKINDYLYHIYTCHIAALASRPRTHVLVVGRVCSIGAITSALLIQS